MNPNPKNFPLLSHVLAKLPSLKRSTESNSDEFDIEQPRESVQSNEPKFDLSERMPQLTDSKVIAAMRSAVSEVSQARSVLQALGDRPDHETVDKARVRVQKIEHGETIVKFDDIDLADVDPEQGERKGEAENERDAYKALISLDEMHDAYEKMLAEAEAKLTKIYEAAVAGYDVGETKDVAQEEVNEEVLAILNEAFEKKTERINLSERQLMFLPEAFARLHGLVVVNLSSNQLQGIPDSIGGLESLEELYLSSNLLESLPDSIGMLLKLKILDVSRNKLVALPDSICHCKSLVELDASFNRLTYLPTNIGYELVNLVKLSIHLNKIRSLPTSIGEMRSLRSLDVHFNELRGLPSSIGELTNLEILNLNSNFSDLKELPNSIGSLTNLRELDLNNNQIHALPDTFGRLENLATLNLDENPLEIPPMEVVEQGVEVIRAFMSKRLLEKLEEEEKRSMLEINTGGQNGWLNRSTSWLTNAVSGVSGYLGSPKPSTEPYLNEQY